MAVYCIALSGTEPFGRLVADPKRSDQVNDLAVLIRAGQFELHVLWPQDDTVWVVVEGEGDIEPLVSLLAERAGGGWDPRLRRVPEAEEPPAELEAGAQRDWIISMVRQTRAANEPDVWVCKFCQRVAVPPHGPHCDADAPAGDVVEPAPGQTTPLAGVGGSEQRLPDDSEAEAVDERDPVGAS